MRSCRSVSFRASRRRRVAKPRLIAFNRPLAAQLGLDAGGLDEAELAGVFGGNVPVQGSEPIAMAYAGHQFGQFVPHSGTAAQSCWGRNATAPACGATFS